MIRKDQVSRAVKDPKWAGRAVLRRIKGRIKGRPPTPSAVARPQAPRPLSEMDRSCCLICGSSNLKVYDIERPKRHYDVRICGRCRYVSNAENTVDYTKFKSVDKFALTPRVGTDDHPGREFHMAKMGAEILKRKPLSVMVFGAGRSLDYQHIAKLPSVDKVIMSDVVDLRGEADFVNITKGTDQRFDLIIACEVVEHFTDPKIEFPRLFDLLTPDGLLVCSTNIYDGGNPDLHSYLYLRGHVSYYSPRSIGVIAKQSNMQFDFRMPKFGPPQVFGKRKRYILFSHSVENMRKTAEYFGSHAYAPAEKPWQQAAADGKGAAATVATEPSATHQTPTALNASSMSATATQLPASSTPQTSVL